MVLYLLANDSIRFLKIIHFIEIMIIIEKTCFG